MATPSKKIALEKDCFEKKAWALGRFIAGVDEVGRGCLAGPVLAAAVVLPLNCANSQLKDSKVLSPQQRSTAYEWIIKNCFVSIGMADQSTIDNINIHQATIVSMKKALYNLCSAHPYIALDAIVVDAIPLTFTHPHLSAIPVHAFYKGEMYSRSIAAASIVAKVTRDRIMTDLDTLFSSYDLKKHKGYATVVHQTNILSHGPAIIHRKTFLSKLLHRSESHDTQKSLF